MPMDRAKYPDDWEQISHRIRFERAGGRCDDCAGQHGLNIIRSDIDPAYYIIWSGEDACFTFPDGEWIKMSEIPAEYDITKPGTTVYLTVHHIGIDKPDGSPGSPHDKLDCREENLIALCQRCHLLADMPYHIQTRRFNRLERKREAARAVGQKELFE